MTTETPSEQEIGEREERSTLMRAWASNDKVQFDNLISNSNNTARIAEISLTNAVNFQNQMNNEYLRSLQQEREHADVREKQDQEHKNTLREHTLENNRYSLDRLFSVFPEEAVGLRVLIKSIAKEVVATKEE